MSQKLYMIIDVTVPENTRIVKVAPLRESGVWGRLLKAQGGEYIAPIMEGRGFSKMTLQQLQYLYWNTFKLAPSDDYATLLAACIDEANKLAIDDTPLEQLEREASKLDPVATTNGNGEAKPAKEPKAPKEPKPAKEPKAPRDPSGRPAPTTTTGMVWDISDECLKEFHTANNTAPGGEKRDVDWKQVRKLVGSRCEKEGINPGTVSVQFGKWKNSQLSAGQG